MTPSDAAAIAAGWTFTGDPNCPGSGQVAVFAPFGAAVPCPVCARLVRIAARLPGEPVTLADHQPPAQTAPTLSLGL